MDVKFSGVVAHGKGYLHGHLPTDYLSVTRGKIATLPGSCGQNHIFGEGQLASWASTRDTLQRPLTKNSDWRRVTESNHEEVSEDPQWATFYFFSWGWGCSL